MEDTDYTMYSEAILGMLSEMSRKLDAIQANSKAKEIQSISQEINPVVSKEEIESIINSHATTVGHYIEHTFKVQTDHHNKLFTSIREVKKQIDALPTPEKVSFQPLIDLFPKQRNVTICGFEFLRTSVIIFVLVLISFFSFVLNIKQMEDYHILNRQYSEQTEYILQMETTE
ncbi:hypothetical protein AGMMS49574_26910 [Bacteroidia bacterium]|nr:hypothetical protein AGMMS49574_26910 [Bacteroidia bacterium]